MALCRIILYRTKHAVLVYGLTLHCTTEPDYLYVLVTASFGASDIPFVTCHYVFFKQVMEMMERDRSSERLIALTISCTYCAFFGRFCLLVSHPLDTGMAGHVS